MSEPQDEPTIIIPDVALRILAAIIVDAHRRGAIPTEEEVTSEQVAQEERRKKSKVRVVRVSQGDRHYTRDPATGKLIPIPSP